MSKPDRTEPNHTEPDCFDRRRRPALIPTDHSLSPEEMGDVIKRIGDLRSTKSPFSNTEPTITTSENRDGFRDAATGRSELPDSHSLMPQERIKWWASAAVEGNRGFIAVAEESPFGSEPEGRYVTMCNASTSPQISPPPNSPELSPLESREPPRDSESDPTRRVTMAESPREPPEPQETTGGQSGASGREIRSLPVRVMPKVEQ